MTITSDDESVLPEVGDWAEDKYDLVETYARLFTTGMKRKWDARVYIDLFAGAGRVRVKETTRTLDAIPMRLLRLPDPFDLYIFCDADASKLAALEARVRSEFAERAVRYVPGDSNANVKKILSHIPTPGKDHKVLSLCVADPYDLKSLNFATIRSISAIFVDFIILIATEMDAHRNLDSYLDPESATVERFLGDSAWREKWRAAGTKAHFGNFVADQFFQQMTTLGYKQQSMPDTHHMRSTKRKLPLYRLAFFSRSDVGADFWKKARQSSTKQKSFW